MHFLFKHSYKNFAFLHESVQLLAQCWHCPLEYRYIHTYIDEQYSALKDLKAMINPNENQPGPLSGSTSNVSVVTVQKISFWPSNPAAWFKVLDNQFTAARVTDELTKFNHVMSMLDTVTIEKCMDIIEGTPTATAYSSFKAEAINRFSESKNSRLQKVLSGIDLGDRKPSQLLNEMKALAGTDFADEALKTLWLQRLPAQVRAILAASSEELTPLSILADKIMETMPSNSIASVANDAFSAPTGRSSSLAALEQQISQLSERFNRLETGRYDRSSRGRQRSRQNDFRGRSQTRSPGRFCFYHDRYGSRARNCRSPCSFQKKIKHSHRETTLPTGSSGIRRRQS